MIKLFRVPISITSRPQALALVSHWLCQWRILNTKYRIPNEKYRIPNTEYRMADSEFSIQNSVLFPKIITTPNPEMIVSAQKDPEFLKALQSADLAIPDGIGIVWALRSLHKRKTVDDGKLKVGVEDRKSKIEKFDPSSTIHPLPPSSIIYHPLSDFHRISGLDFMESLISKAAKNDWRVLLLGGKPGVAEKAAKKLQNGKDGKDGSHPNTPNTPNTLNHLNHFCISLSSPQNISKISKSDNDRFISEINSFSPDLLFVAFGHGQQEKWLNTNRHRLNAGVAMGVGGALDQIADPSLRPPVYINSIGLGWLYRLLREPRRWKRQLALVKFVGMVFRQKFR